MDSEFLNSKDCDYSCYQNPFHAVIAGTRDAARTNGSCWPSGKNHSAGPGEGRSRSLFVAHPNLPHILLSHTFSISCHFSCRHPPHPKTAKSGNKRQETAILYRSKWAWSKDYTPYPCFVCKYVQWGTRSGKNMRSLCKSVQ